MNANARIDSCWISVMEINGTDYRMITTDPTGNLVVDPRPAYRDDDPGPAGDRQEIGSPYYVDSSKNVVNSDGKAVYRQTGNGTKANNDPNNRVAADPWRYTRAKADPTDKVPDLNRNFNEESIAITIPTSLTLKRVKKLYGLR